MIGAALATDHFLIRDQLADHEWDVFLRTRRFVDEEVLPVINGYWERAEFPWPLARRLAELGLLDDGVSPLAPSASCTWSSTAATGASARSTASRRDWR
jgi:glutaryl-CoA dehydrogenase